MPLQKGTNGKFQARERTSTLMLVLVTADFLYRSHGTWKHDLSRIPHIKSSQTNKGCCHWCFLFFFRLKILTVVISIDVGNCTKRSFFGLLITHLATNCQFWKANIKFGDSQTSEINVCDALKLQISLTENSHAPATNWKQLNPTVRPVNIKPTVHLHEKGTVLG